MRYLIFTIFLAALVVVIACARPVANAANDNAASQNTATATEPAGTNIQPIPTPPPAEEVPRISLADAKKAFDDGTGYFIDARPADAYNDEHIKGAVNITYDKLDAHLKDLKTKQKIIVYCS
jgi:3-mercaptopyruvate sulfurtransferase SseA